MAANDVSQHLRLCVFQCVALTTHFLFLKGNLMGIENPRVSPNCGFHISVKKHIKRIQFLFIGSLLAVVVTVILIIYEKLRKYHIFSLQFNLVLI